MTMRKLILICLLGTVLACTRSTESVVSSGTEPDSPTTTITTTAISWQNHGGNTGATNAVSSLLPSSISSVGSTTISEGIIYAAPVVSYTSSTAQRVYVLAIDGTTLTVIGYDYDGSSLTEAWSASLTASSANPEYHRLALNSDADYLFVTTAAGIIKLDVADGSQESSYETGKEFGNLLIDSSDNLYAVDSTCTMHKTDTAFSSSNEYSLGCSSLVKSTGNIPMVMSGDGAYIYVGVEGDTVYQFDIEAESTSGLTSDYFPMALLIADTSTSEVYFATISYAAPIFFSGKIDAYDGVSNFYNSSGKATSILGTTQDLETASIFLFRFDIDF